MRSRRAPLTPAYRHVMFDEAALVAELVSVHAAHTVVLYGSRARGDATEESDVDVAAFADVAETTRDARRWSGMFLDVFIHPTAVAHETADDQLKLVGGRVLHDERSLGVPLLARLAAREAAGPAPLPETEARMRRVWLHKMLARIRRGDLEARYRHHWLLFQILEDDFALHGEWFKGPKRGLVELRERRPETYAALVAALAPSAPVEALVALVTRVAGPEPCGG